MTQDWSNMQCPIRKDLQNNLQLIGEPDKQMERSVIFSMTSKEKWYHKQETRSSTESSKQSNRTRTVVVNLSWKLWSNSTIFKDFCRMLLTQSSTIHSKMQ